MEKTPRLIIATVFTIILFINVVVLQYTYSSLLPPLDIVIQLLFSFGAAGFSYALLGFIKRKKISLTIASILLVGMILYQLWSYSSH